MRGLCLVASVQLRITECSSCGSRGSYVSSYEKKAIGYIFRLPIRGVADAIDLTSNSTLPPIIFSVTLVVKAHILHTTTERTLLFMKVFYI